MSKTRTEQISARLPDFMAEWLRLGTDGLTGELKDSVRRAMITRDFDRYRDIYAGDLDLIQVLNITPTMIESENPDESTAMVAYILVQGAAAKLAEAVSSMVRTGAVDPKVTERIRLWLLADRATFNNQGEDIVIYLSRRWRNHVAVENGAASLKSAISNFIHAGIKIDAGEYPGIESVVTTGKENDNAA